MMTCNPYVMISATAAVSYCVGFLVRWMLHRIQALDRPNERSSHTSATVRGGGLGIVIVVICASAIGMGETGGGVFLGALLLGALMVVSFVDDLRRLSWGIRLGIHSACAAGFAAAVIFGAAGDAGLSGGIWIPAMAAFLLPLGYCNAFNFMDGINGIAALQAAVTAIGTFVIANVSGATMTGPEACGLYAIAGAALGFLPHNFPRARMFMGDSGSVPLGFGLAACSVAIAARCGWWLLIPFSLLHANFVLDTAITLMRRVWAGKPFSEPHRDHFYQRLIRAGKGHTFVTISELLLQMLVLSIVMQYPTQSSMGRVGIAIVVTIVWLMFFWYAERSFRNSLARDLR